MEVCGALLSSSLRETTKWELKYQYVEMLHTVDSTFMRSQIQKEFHKIPLAANRIAEIQEKSQPSG